MRAEWLKRLTLGWEWTWVDVDRPFERCGRFWRSTAFRFRKGRAVTEVNRDVREQITGREFDLTWVDKGVLLDRMTMENVRERSKKLIHFTPDTAFHENQSKHFEGSIKLYDLVVTTKSFEIDHYRSLTGASRVFLTTQGFDPELHVSHAEDFVRQRAVAFIGLAEADREDCLGRLIDAGVQVYLGGKGWRGFLRRRGRNPNLYFLGERIFGAEYRSAIAGCWVGIGLLSKRFPELHTTRTFEIPACGTILATEKNVETSKYFNANEAMFFQNHTELAVNVRNLFDSASNGDLATRARAGRLRVIHERRDYPSILADVLAHPQVGIRTDSI